MKKFTKIFAVALAASGVIVLSACGSGSLTTGTSPNWNASVGKNDLNEDALWLNYKEVAQYSLSYAEGSNSTYSFVYEEGGTYTTQLYAVEYDWTRENTVAGRNIQIPENYRSENDKEFVYVYTTSLSVPATVKMKNSSSSYSYDNTVETISIFRSADSNLKPVYSYQSIDNIYPRSFNASSLNQAYLTMNREYETFYNKDCSKATVTCTVNDGDSEYKTNGNNVSSESASGLKSSGYSLFDSTMLATALRSFSYGNHTFNVFIPINGGLSKFNTSSSGAKTLDYDSDADKPIIDALNAAKDAAVDQSENYDGYLFAGEDDDGNKTYKYNSVTLNLNSEMMGQPSVYYYANIASGTINSARAVMVKMETPVYFNLGKLTYSLSSLNRVSQ